MDGGSVYKMISERAELFYNRAAFTSRDGQSRSFGEFLTDAAIFGAALAARELAGRPAAIIGEVTCGTVEAVLGCLATGSPVVPLSQSLGLDGLCALAAEYEIGTVFCSSGCMETALLMAERCGLTVFADDPEALRSPVAADAPVPDPDPMSPAFLFSVPDGGGVLLSHKNICDAIEAVALIKDISSYTFLTPAVWGGAFDCVIGLLLPLWAGCGLVQRGEKRGAVKAISESGVSAVTCTPQRLRGLERSLRLKTEKKRGRLAQAAANLLERAGRLLSPDINKRMHRRIHLLLGDSLKLIICGGVWPEQTCARRFTDWGTEVLSLWFTAECGPLAAYDGAQKKLVPLAELSVPLPIKGDAGELCLSGERIPIGYFGGRTEFDGFFPTGDVGSITADGTLELRGRRKTMLYGKDGEMIFPEELTAVIRKNRYVNDCYITGRYDTKTADVILTAHITPEAREVSDAIGEKYSANRLRLFFNRVMEKLADELPHRIQEFTLPD